MEHGGAAGDQGLGIFGQLSVAAVPSEAAPDHPASGQSNEAVAAVAALDDGQGQRLDVPPVYFLASAALMLLLHLGLPGPQLVHCTWRWLGLLPVVVGVALAVAGEQAFNLNLVVRGVWTRATPAASSSVASTATGTLPTPISRIRRRTSLTSGM